PRPEVLPNRVLVVADRLRHGPILEDELVREHVGEPVGVVTIPRADPIVVEPLELCSVHPGHLLSIGVDERYRGEEQERKLRSPTEGSTRATAARCRTRCRRPGRTCP